MLLFSFSSFPNTYQNIYCSSTLYPNIFWVDMKDVDFSEGAPVRMLDLVGGRTYAGNTASLFVEAEPFEFERVD